MAEENYKWEHRGIQYRVLCQILSYANIASPAPAHIQFKWTACHQNQWWRICTIKVFPIFPRGPCLQLGACLCLCWQSSKASTWFWFSHRSAGERSGPQHPALWHSDYVGTNPSWAAPTPFPRATGVQYITNKIPLPIPLKLSHPCSPPPATGMPSEKGIVETCAQPFPSPLIFPAFLRVFLARRFHLSWLRI